MFRARQVRLWPQVFGLVATVGSCVPAAGPAILPVAEVQTLEPRGAEGSEVKAALAAQRVRDDADWCVGAGAPIPGEPVVDPRGRIYLATTDGYVHSFESDGRYRWSYTVKGTITGGVSLRPSDGAVLVGTTERLVYAITAGGQLNWSFRTIAPVVTGLTPSDPTTVLFGGSDGFLYALSMTGGARWRVPLGGLVTAPPLITRPMVAWVPVGAEIFRVEGSWRVLPFDLGGDIVTPPVPLERSRPEQTPGGLAVVAGDTLRALDGAGKERWSRAGVAYVASYSGSRERGESAERAETAPPPGGARVAALSVVERDAARGDQVVFLDAAGQTVSEPQSLPARVSAPPADIDGLLYVPLESGQLIVMNPNGVVATKQASRAALGRPQRASDRVVLATDAAEVCAVRLVETRR